jgi:hypothetical protein
MAIKIRRDSSFTETLLSNLRKYYEDKKQDRIGNSPIHVSDILPSICIRKQYYSRLNTDRDLINEDSLHHFIRGESSEFAITRMANTGIAQADLNFEGLVAHPDIMTEDQIVELKDTISGKRLDLTDQQFRSYLRQLLYYLVITGIEKGIISIRYVIGELNWVKSDDDGDHYIKPKNSKNPGIESWSVYLPKNDITRDILKNEIVRRKNLLECALNSQDASILPRLIEPMKSRKCPHCPFYDLCYNKDRETQEAIEMAAEKDLLDISGVLDYRPFFDGIGY